MRCGEDPARLSCIFESCAMHFQKVVVSAEGSVWKFCVNKTRSAQDSRENQDVLRGVRHPGSCFSTRLGAGMFQCAWSVPCRPRPQSLILRGCIFHLHAIGKVLSSSVATAVTHLSRALRITKQRQHVFGHTFVVIRFHHITALAVSNCFTSAPDVGSAHSA